MVGSVVSGAREVAGGSARVVRAGSTGRGAIVGQETSGGYLGDSSGIEALLSLPATGMTFNANLVAYHMAVPRQPGRQGGVVPTIAITYTIDDLIAGRDLEMDAVFKRERAQPSPNP